MSDLIKVAIPGTITLLVAVVGALIAYRKWKVEQERSRTADFRESQKAAYKELWDRVEDVHVQIRTKEMTRAEFSTLVRDVNSFLLKREIYFDDDLRGLVNEYLTTVFQLKTALEKEESSNEMVTT